MTKREILFRGKKIDNGEWVKGDLVTCESKFYIHPQSNVFNVKNCLSSCIVLKEVDPQSVVEYTGMKDKNGTRVFFGDICKGGGFLYKVVEFAGKAVLMSVCKSYYMDLGKHNTYVEVIGNKFDNPELLAV